ncbi:hypothetical protein [Paraburkholderia largidicola]|uniref:Uncharacterized protein n=1 Tax=Paraburkholderia largidicola TaxID=3014751 RepID=A0A7I8BLS8_9BURK|nr:hypothetical protein [Paraburkholderia sp. PGU16]BCF89090.1 hypothetical protein PPGU16_21570 [Paraburkholderia sp. PGU16]
MTRRLKLDRFDDYAFAPSTDDVWFDKAEESVEFLKELTKGDEVLIHAIGPQLLISGVLAPAAQVTPADHDDLMNGYVDWEDTWCIQQSYGGGRPHEIYLEPPLAGCGCKSLRSGEPLFFKRSFLGVDVPQQIELSQKLIHCLELYFMADRSAYCRLDDRGDIEEVIRIVRRHADDPDRETTIITILAKDLSRYMTVSGMALVYFFDFTRFRPSGFNGWDDHGRLERRAPDLFYDVGFAHQASFANGRLIVRPTITVDDLVAEWKDELDGSKREYATFKIFDRKNGCDVETSCGPDSIVNYFTESDLPWEISPAFFRPEVLHRFKADPDKFTMEHRSISCRGAWYLKGYDVNEVGQVHVYIGDLARLPIEEQRYWQSFNEWPKGTISKRAYENDIRGEFSSEYDPLDSLKRKVSFLNEKKPEWWSFRSESVMATAHYPVTDSVREWGDEIMALDQMLVEGLMAKPLKSYLQAARVKFEPNWGSLRILQEYAAMKGKTVDEAQSLMAPLRELHSLRTTLRGHTSTTDRKDAEQAARRDFGGLDKQYRDLTARCDAAMKEIVGLLGLQCNQD